MKVEIFVFLEANRSQNCGVLPKNKEFNFPGPQMMANAHFVPLPIYNFDHSMESLEMVLTLCKYRVSHIELSVFKWF